MGTRLRKVLIANRGEIAIRIIRACHQLGIATVAVFSEPDREALHVRAAGEAYALGGVTAAESYLNSGKLLEIASLAGADAVHPGYGFLSENQQFANAVEEQGLTFIGPRAVTIGLMGDKSAAKELMRKAGVPIIPGYSGEDQGDQTLRAEAEKIGLPLLVKAAHGGGGKGMRVVRSMAAFQTALEAARRESEAAFGSGRLLLEKYLDPVRHIEIQILGDSHGNQVHLLERECSIQRRHQKLLEESPSPSVSAQLRAALGKAALASARAVNYRNAGTVEFLLDARGRFYFLEMNTRLQVEHPVTEWVTGIDLVHAQLRIAAGEPLAIEQKDIAPRGHAIEARLYAEDPAKGFAPQSGVVKELHEPSGPGVRIDSCLYAGCEVSMHYDPMLAKVIGCGATRAEAIAKLDWALSNMLLCGIATNIPYLREVLAMPAFREGQTDTRFLERLLPSWEPRLPPLEIALIAAYHGATAVRPHGRKHPSVEVSPWTTLTQFRLGETPGLKN